MTHTLALMRSTESKCSLWHRMLDASKENCIHIPTGGTVSDNQYRLLLFNLHLQPLTLARVTVPKPPSHS